MSRSHEKSADGLNDMLGGVRRIVDALQSAVDDDSSFDRTVQFGTTGDEVEAVVGIRVATGIGGATVSVRETVEPMQPDADEADDVRRPVVDVFDEKTQVRILAEIPGVGPNDVELTVKGDKFVLSAETDRRTYWRAVSLPRPVDEDGGVVDVEAGLVEIVFPVAENGGNG